MTVPHLTILTCARSDARFPDFTKVECSVMVTGMFAVSPARGRASRSYEAQRERRLADAESYAHVRHPQYAGLMLAIAGALAQWPTLITLAMAPVLLVTYWRLATREDRELEAQFSDRYRAYRERVPAFIPASMAFWRRQGQTTSGEPDQS